MNPTMIQWTWRRDPVTGELVPKSGSTWNPLLGCRRISTGCEGCYAERLISTRLSKHRYYLDIARMTDHGPRWTGEQRLIVERLKDPLRATKGRNIFVCDLSDIFFEGNPFEEIAAVFGVMGLARQHTFQVLTKRMKRALEFQEWVTTREVGVVGGRTEVLHPFAVCAREAYRRLPEYRPFRAKNLPLEVPWPLSNVHLGTSVENQGSAEERIPLLLKMPAARRFLSVEPLLEAVRLHQWLMPFVRPGHCIDIDGNFGHNPGTCRGAMDNCDGRCCGLGIDWVICGGESGPRARPFDIEWARSLRDQCKDAGVPFFMKQLGAKPFGAWSPNRRELGWTLLDAHGSVMAEWPADLRVRQLLGEAS